VDRAAIAREGRRAQALEALAFEREREDALDAQLRQVVLEAEGDRVDALAFAQMTPDDARRVRETLGMLGGDGPDDEPLEGDELDDPADEGDEEDTGPETEISRLEEELERCRALQRALERFVEALDGTS
jgi:hypothetical protein